jgi:hypothetical protein
MHQAIRALGWATKLLWIILIAIILTIAYSATQISVAFGEPQTTMTGQAVTLSFPISVNNQGLYDLSQLNFTTKITDLNGQSLAEGTTVAQLIPRGSAQTMIHTVTIDLAGILAQNASFLFNDTDLTVFQYVSLNYANAIPLSVHANQPMPWGAPLSNFAIGDPAFQFYNSTHSIVSVQLYFENHNQYVPVTGDVRVEIYTTRQSFKGSGTANINAQSGMSCSTQVDVLVSNFRSVPPRGEVRVFFDTTMFDYGPVVVSFGF